MKKTTFAGAALLTLALASPSFARTDVSIGINLGNAPPPPMVVYQRSPQWVAVPNEGVYVVNDDNLGYDYFRCGGMYYIYNGGYWYRSPRYRGPFVAIETRYVPRQIWTVRDRGDYRWRHRPDAPPGWSHGKAKWKDRGDDDDQGHGHGHGKDHDHRR